MISKRIEKLRSKMAQVGIDGLLIMKPENRKYISGFTGTAGVILVTQKQNILLTDFRYIDQAKEEAPLFQIIKYQFPYLNTLKEVIDRLPIEHLGFESEFVTYNQHLELNQELNPVKLTPQKGLIEQLRMVKDCEEIKAIEKAAQITDLAFSHILNFIKPGLKEIEVAIELEHFMRTKGASSTAFSTIVASGHRSSLPHGVASNKIIEMGDLITIDFGCIYNSYCSDMTRTIIMGSPTSKQKEIYEIVLEAQMQGLQYLRSGLAAQEVDKISRNIINSKGYGEYFGHGLGHSLGLNVHESPSLSPRDNTQLLNNMVVTVEPGIYIPGWGGVRIEDLVVVLDNGCKTLTSSSKELIIL